MVSIKNPSPALPTANNTVSHVPTPGSQPQALAEPAAITSPLSSAGVAYAIISTAPSHAAAIAPSTAVSAVSDSIKVQPLLISADNQVSACPRAGGPTRPGGRRREGSGEGGPGGARDQLAEPSGGPVNGWSGNRGGKEQSVNEPSGNRPGRSSGEGPAARMAGVAPDGGPSERVKVGGPRWDSGATSE